MGGHSLFNPAIVYSKHVLFLAFVLCGHHLPAIARLQIWTQKELHLRQPCSSGRCSTTELQVLLWALKDLNLLFIIKSYVHHHKCLRPFKTIYLKSFYIFFLLHCHLYLVIYQLVQN